MASADVNSEVYSPSSSLPVARGEDTEALFGFPADETSEPFRYPDPVFPETETALQDGGELEQVRHLFKRPRRSSDERTPLESPGTGDPCKPQKTFSALVNLIAEECNEAVRLNSRLEEQISDVALRLQRKEKAVFSMGQSAAQKVVEVAEFHERF